MEPIERISFVSPLREFDRLQVVTGIWLLSQHAELQRNYPAGMFELRTEPTIVLGQFFYYADFHGAPAGFCNWAFVTQAVLDDHLATGRNLQPHEFNCGDLPLFYEFLAPFGHALQLVHDLRERFKGQCVPAVRGSLAVEMKPIKVQYFRF